MTRPNIDQARCYALGRLERELPSIYTYHSLAHTRDDVTPAALRLAALAQIGAEDALLLQTAALYHDIGFLEDPGAHELAGARIAGAILPEYGYSPAQVARVQRLIMVTRLPQSPTDLVEQLMADADLDLLGREDFPERNALLRLELANLGRTFSDAEWFRDQIAFLGGHRYWSPQARTLRDQQKSRNVQLMRERYEASSR